MCHDSIISHLSSSFLVAWLSHADDVNILCKILIISNAIFCVTAQIVNTQTELKKLAEQNPELKDAYLAKQRRLKVSKLL